MNFDIEKHIFVIASVIHWRRQNGDQYEVVVFNHIVDLVFRFHLNDF